MLICRLPRGIPQKQEIHLPYSIETTGELQGKHQLSLVIITLVITLPRKCEFWGEILWSVSVAAGAAVYLDGLHVTLPPFCSCITFVIGKQVFS